MRISISDPAQHTITTLDPQQKTAFVSGNYKGSNAAGILPPGSAVAVPPVGTATSPTNAKTEELGSKVIEGLTVTGVRTMSLNSWAVGGDAKTFTSTTEVWTSPELGIVVLSETTDSMGTHQVTKLVDLARTEPAAALFQVPSGYTVRDDAPRAASSGR
jgi:hypothetical protein